ncbi:TonB-dependent receptor plug domain-containing protein [Thalassomonas haliotis]|uniref:TonB-dependent receptor n=1 Tax=Thalassomonas haliotis TaxID=485448 RepID=A0ABY7VN39_9GAMM|nr:TonB-dependent receptor [Thalassomonas haliotis]WDE13947.1 TonB-dependent receptor [Thalassomonas haliotis]
MSKYSSVKLSALSAAMISSASVIATPVFAATVADENEEHIEKIMVTGSRIARTELSSSSPITVVSKVQMERLGITDVGEALRKLPSLTGNTANAQSDSGAGSVATVTLRGIEASNTLILINGRRTIAANAENQVDLLSIPFEAVEQIQVLKDGASAIYGSDAIAGVVNIITKNNFEGAGINASYGISGRGDGAEKHIGLTLGASSDRGSLMIALAQNNTDGWLSRDRTRTQDADFRHVGGQNQRSGTAPNARLTGFGLGEGDWTVLDAANPGDVIPWDYDVMGYNYHDVTSGSNTLKNTTMFFTGEYELTDDVQVFAEISSYQGWNRGNQAPPGVDTAWYGSGTETPAFHHYDADGNQFGVGAKQKYNPFGVEGNVSRRFVEYGPRVYTTETDVTRYTLGFNGAFGDYDWNLTYSSQEGRMTTDGGLQPSLMRIDAALSDECGTSEAPDCVPLNVFGPPGTITREMLDYINVTKPFSINDNTLDYYQASLAGPVMELPAGTMQFAIGYEHREEQSKQRADISQQTETFDVSWGEATSDVVSPVRKIDEFYAELVIPTLDILEVQLAVRHSKYSDLGETTTNPKFGVIYKPLAQVTLRGSYSTGFRAPTMLQMYSKANAAFTEGIADPCDPSGTGVVANMPGCAGLVDGNILNTVKGFNVNSGGNSELMPEEAKNLTLGLVYQASDKLSLTLDYFKITQENVVFQSPEYVLDQAYVAQNPDYTDQVTRALGGTGYIVSVNAPNDNIAERTLDGLDLALMYGFDTYVGDWDINLQWSHFLTFDVQDTADSPSRSIAGLYDNSFGNIPEDRANLTLGWSKNDWSVTYNVEYLSATDEPGGHVMGSSHFHNAQVDYFYDPLGLDINLGVKNLWDKEPPLRYEGTNGVDYNTYSLRGSFFYMRLAKEF